MHFNSATTCHCCSGTFALTVIKHWFIIGHIVAGILDCIEFGSYLTEEISGFGFCAKAKKERLPKRESDRLEKKKQNNNPHPKIN